MDSHLVTIEVGIERRTCQGVKLDGLTFNHAWLESLDTQTVQCRGTVQQYRMTLHHVLQDIPDNGFLAVHNLLGRLDRLHNAALDELTDDERLVQLSRHQLRNTAFAHLQFRTYHNNGTSGIVHTLTQQILTETALLTLQAVRQGL